MASCRQFLVLCDNEIVKSQGQVCVITKIYNQGGPLVKSKQSSVWYRTVQMCVRPW